MRAALRWHRWAAVIAASLVLCWLFSLLAPSIHLPPAVGFGLAFAALGCVVLAVGSVTPPAPLRALGLMAFALALLVWAASLGARGGVATPLMVAAALLCAGSLLGGVVAARIQHRGHLWVVALVASMADLFSVLSAAGPSSHVVASPRALSLVAISWPIPGTTSLAPMLGVGDVVMVTLFLVAARHLGLGRLRALLGLAVGFGATLALLLTVAVPVPALPLLGAGFVALDPRVWTLRREDRRPALLGLAFVAAVFGALWLSSR